MPHSHTMSKARICVLERHTHDVCRRLGQVGLLHLSQDSRQDEPRLKPEVTDEDAARVAALSGRLERLRERLGLPVPPSGAVATEGMGLDEIEAAVDAVAEQVAAPLEALTELERRLVQTEALLTDLTPWRNLRVPVQSLAGSDFVEMRAGMLPVDKWDALQAELPAGVVALATGEPDNEQKIPLIIVASRRRKYAVETVLNGLRFCDTPLPAGQERTPADIYAEADERRGDIQAHMLSVRAQLGEIGERWSGMLARLATELDVLARMLAVEEGFSTTWATSVITGWVPTSRTEDLERAVMDATGGRAVVELTPPTAEDLAAGRVPRAASEHPWLAPFARLVQGYGTASYTELEPTLMFAVSFLLLFGIIFGDAGHGLCVLGLGVLIRRKAQGQAMRDIGFVAAACGAASAVFGTFFQGTLFGLNLHGMGFPLTLGIEPLRIVPGQMDNAAHEVIRYLLLALGFGVVFISLGVVSNIVNRLRRGDWTAGLLGRFGVAGLALYWGILGTLAKVVLKPGPMDGALAVLLIVVPLAVVALHEPLARLVGRRRPLMPHGIVVGIFECLIEAMEALMVYVSNSLSFLRVAAFALSHAVLSFTILALREVVADWPGGPLWGVLVLVVGTAAMIALEGLIVGIQILRLEYYEFFTKFFGGQGTRYEPFHLRERTSE
jgi:V/A-type H+/Na+-transporting ATPase subunit I